VIHRQIEGEHFFTQAARAWSISTHDRGIFATKIVFALGCISPGLHITDSGCFEPAALVVIAGIRGGFFAIRPS